MFESFQLTFTQQLFYEDCLNIYSKVSTNSPQIEPKLTVNKLEVTKEIIKIIQKKSRTMS